MRKSDFILKRGSRFVPQALLVSAALFGIFIVLWGAQRPFVQQFSLDHAALESFIPQTDEIEQFHFDPNQLNSISLRDTNIWTQITVKTGDTLAKIFQRLGLSADQLEEVLQTSNEAKYLSRLFPGQVLHFLIENDQLRALAQPLDPSRTLFVFQEPEGFKSVLHEKEIESRVAFGSGRIDSSLLASGKEAGLDHRVLMQLADIFGYDIDFAMDLQPNDSFRLLYEEQYVEGQRTKTGNVLAAEFMNDGHLYRAVRFEDEHGRVNYYTPNGESMRKAFIRTPVSFTHVSSHFNLHRKHPILHKIRAHRGVDYAAPVGTPVHAAGDGHVQYVGSKNGYGNTIILQHGKKYSTLYAHLSRFHSGLKSGHKVRQGQVIGYVGMTGLASGPHLHYEFRVDGIHRNPLTVNLPMAEPLPYHTQRKFKKHAHELLQIMDRHEKLASA